MAGALRGAWDGEWLGSNEPYRQIMLLLAYILLLAVFFDIRERRIPNPLIVAGLAAGLVVSFQTMGMHGLIASSEGCLLGVAVFIPFFVLRQLGAGDVKLMGVVGAFVGVDAMFKVILYTLIAGGLVGAIALVGSGKLAPFFLNLRLWLASLGVSMGGKDAVSFARVADSSVLRIPYALAIAMGALLWMWLES